MTRLHAIALALRIAAPGWHWQDEAAQLLEQLERRYHIRAELVIADAEHESRWQPGVVNPLSGTVGLMQIQPLNIRYCGATLDRWSTECWQVREQVADWRTNLRIGTSYFAYARSYCEKLGRGALAVNWLQLPTGWDAVRHARCGYRGGHRLPTPAGVTRLLRRMHELEAR